MFIKCHDHDSGNELDTPGACGCGLWQILTSTASTIDIRENIAEKTEPTHITR